MSDSQNGLSNPQTDRRGRKLGLNPDQLSERGRRAGAASHSISAYVRRIVRDAPQLSDDDVAALRSILGPAAYADVYADGVKAGVKLAAEKLTELAAS